MKNNSVTHFLKVTVGILGYRNLRFQRYLQNLHRFIAFAIKDSMSVQKL